MGDSSSHKRKEQINLNSSMDQMSLNTDFEGMPQMQRVETFEERVYRKFTQQPLVPIGCMVTAYCLGSGIRSFMKRDMVRSQKMMRARVAAQGATVLVFVGYAAYNQYNSQEKTETDAVP